jgi:hypothetical protein
MFRVTPIQFNVQLFLFIAVLGFLSSQSIAQDCFIIGDSTACNSEVITYHLEDTVGASETVEWQSSGTIVQVIPPNSVQIRWQEGGIQYVRASILNSQGIETRACQKSVGVSIEHFRRLSVDNDLLACAGEASLFSLSQFSFLNPGPVNVEWILDSVTIQDGNKKELSYIFPSSGSYTLCARAYDQYCASSDPFCIEVTIEAPPLMPEITLLGVDEGFPVDVCLGQNMMFSSSTELTQYHIIHEESGAEWNYRKVSGLQGFAPSMAGTYDITVWGVDESGTCLSTPNQYEFTVSADSVMQVECPSLVCVGDTVSYVAQADCAKYTWSVSSEGEILSGQDTDSVTVVWKSSPPLHGYGTISVNKWFSQYIVN